MALKVRCPWCDELTTFDAETDTFSCVCGTTVKLPEGKAESDPYQGWGACYQSDLKRKRPDACSGTRGRKRKPPAKPPARFNPNYYDV
jgi:hypothetical protein